MMYSDIEWGNDGMIYRRHFWDSNKDEDSRMKMLSWKCALSKDWPKACCVKANFRDILGETV